MTLTAYPSVGYAKLIGTVGSGLLAGGQICVSHLTVPALLASGTMTASQLQAQWQHVYDIGKTTAPPLALLSSTAFLYVAWSEYERALPRSSPWPWVGAAALTTAVIPYTLIFMMSNVRTLQSLGGGTAELKSTEPQVRRLVTNWAKMHLVRVAFTTAGFGIAAWVLVWG